MPSFGRRINSVIPRLPGRPWNDVAEEFQTWVDEVSDAQDNGLPPGFSDTTPSTVEIGSSGSPGDEATGWAAADHDHPVGDPGPPADVGAAASEGSSTTPAREDHVHKIGVVTTKGDLLVFGTTPARLPVGANGEPLVADSSQTLGLRYISPWKGARTKTLTNNTVVGLFEVALAAGSICGGAFSYAIRVIDAGGELQVESGVVTFAATNKGGVYATDIDKGTNSAPTPTSGTITVTFSIVTGADKITVSVNANSSLTPTTLDARYMLDSLDGNAITFL